MRAAAVLLYLLALSAAAIAQTIIVLDDSGGAATTCTSTCGYLNQPSGPEVDSLASGSEGCRVYQVDLSADCPESSCGGNIDDLEMFTRYADDPASEFKWVVYDDSGGEPNSLICVSNAMYTDVAPGGGEWTIPSKRTPENEKLSTAGTCSVTEGAVIWIGYCQESTMQNKWDSGSTVFRSKLDSSYFDTPPASWPTSTDTDGNTSHENGLRIVWE